MRQQFPKAADFSHKKYFSQAVVSRFSPLF
jgi:hypothetical protein